MKRKPTTARCRDCRFADIAQHGNNPAIARCRAPGSERPPQVAMARIVCRDFVPKETGTGR